MDINARERLILALDLPSADDAKRLMDRVGQEIVFVKIGLELFTAAGPGIVRWAIQQGKQVFLDFKLLDIGETIKRATAAASELGATFLTVHAGTKAIRAAVEGRGASPLKILGVTVLTNFADSDLEELGIRESMSDAVVRRARLATAWGADGLIAAGPHLEGIRMMLGSKPIIVTPGIRPVSAFPDDQVSVATPTLALAAGADYLVVGRAVRNAQDPATAARAIQGEIAAACK
ncbi:MAG: orotidine-5'-phosphate decarboxylase [Nitrospirota bacterium]